MNPKTLAALAGIGLVMWYLVRRYTSDPFASLAAVAAGDPAPATPTFTGLPLSKPPKQPAVAAAEAPAFPYSAPSVPNVAPPTVFPSPVVYAPLPSSPDDYDAIWAGEQKAAKGDVRVFTEPGAGYQQLQNGSFAAF